VVIPSDGLDSPGRDHDVRECEALTLSTPELAGWLRDHLGPRLAAFTLDVPDLATVERYAAGEGHPTDRHLWRMRRAYAAGHALHNAFGDVTVKSWFFGSNRMLGDRAPAAVVRRMAGPADAENVLPAARAFIAGDPS
jgi:hypothetical protein